LLAVTGVKASNALLTPNNVQQGQHARWRQKTCSFSQRAGYTTPKVYKKNLIFYIYTLETFGVT